MSRRRVLLGTGALAAATTGSIALASDNASATVSGDFSIPDSQTVLADQSLQDIRLSADVSWSFEANAPIHGVELELHVGSTADTLDLIARHENTDIGTDALAGEQTLNGSLMSASDFSISDFEPSGGELSTSVVAELRFYAIRDGEVAAEARQTDTFAVTVSDEELQVNVTLGGTGSVEFQTG